MRFVLLNGPYDGATGDMSPWEAVCPCPEVVWVGYRPELGGRNGLAVAPYRKSGRVPYERVEVVNGTARYVFGGGPSGLPPSSVDEERLVNA